jgi:hypothetical protein
VINGESVWRIASCAYLSVDSNVLRRGTLIPYVGDIVSDVWVTCVLALIAMHESNPTPQRLKLKILKGWIRGTV